MKACNFLLVLFLVLLPGQYFQNCEPKGVSCDYVPSSDPRIRGDHQRPENYVSTGYYKTKTQDAIEDDPEPVPVKVHYEDSDAEKCSKAPKTNMEEEEELANREIDTVQQPKKNKQMQNTWKAAEKVVKIDFAKPAPKCAVPTRKGSILCADCEQCELQVKSNGEGVMVKCKNCREAAPHEVIFPAGNNRKIISLP